MTAKAFSLGAKVQWKWMGRNILGEVVEIYFEPISKKIKDKIIKRNGSKDNPAYVVKSLAGNTALKLQSELLTMEIDKSKSAKPKMFS